MSKTAQSQHKLLARWALEAQAPKGEHHFAHLQSLRAVMDYRTSIEGSAPARGPYL